MEDNKQTKGIIGSVLDDSENYTFKYEPKSFTFDDPELWKALSNEHER